MFLIIIMDVFLGPASTLLILNFVTVVKEIQQTLPANFDLINIYYVVESQMGLGVINRHTHTFDMNA